MSETRRIHSLKGKCKYQQLQFKRLNSSELLDYANMSREAGTFNDVTISVDNETIAANRMVLSCYSHFFERLFKSNMKEKYQSSVEVNGVDPNTMKILIAFIYTGKMNIDNDNVCDLLAASDYLQITDSRSFCINFLERTITLNTCFIILDLADRYSSTKLLDKVKQFIGNNFKEVVKTKDFKELPKNEMLNSISKQNTVPETLKYNAVVEWSNFDLEKRQPCFSEIFKAIDLNKLTAAFLSDVVWNEILVKQDPSCIYILCDSFANRQKTTNQENIPDPPSQILSIGGTYTRKSVKIIYNNSTKPARKFPDLPVGREEACSVVLNDVVYLIGGATPNGTTSNLVYRMDLKRNHLKWEQIPSMNSRRQNMGAAVLDGVIYVVGGYDSETQTGSATGECYSPGSKKWKNIPSLTFTRNPRNWSTLVACKGYLYYFGAFEHICNERLKPGTATWEKVTPHSARETFSAVVLNDIIYVIGGYDENSLGTGQKYDDLTDSWTFIAEMIMDRKNGSGCALQGKVYISGGRDFSGRLAESTECYDPAVGKWSIVGEVAELECHSTVAI